MITYRSNERNTLRAAYCGSVRVGYIEDRERFTAQGWRWQLIMLQPDGGAYWGFVDDESAAKAAIEAAFAHWLAEAGLQPKETNDDSRRNESKLQRVAPVIKRGDAKATKQKRRGTKDSGVLATRNPTHAKRSK